MSFVLDLLELHIEQGTGYPFAAAVFDGEHRLISIGVNYSSALFNSTAHAELLALQFAQAAIKRPYLPKKGEYSLVTSAQPCVMCSGAIFLSGVREVVTAALESDIQEIMGFGLGPLSSLWREDFVGKTISVREGVDRERARQLMRSYRSKFDTRRT
jgi:tRNA(Arg) A34 adenosine deaminase TadA